MVHERKRAQRQARSDKKVVRLVVMVRDGMMLRRGLRGCEIAIKDMRACERQGSRPVTLPTGLFAEATGTRQHNLTASSNHL
jgi:hypothetical protein